MTRLIDADKFKENMRYVCDAGGWLEPVTKAVTEYVKKQIDAQPTVDAIPVEWLSKLADECAKGEDPYVQINGLLINVVINRWEGRTGETE